MKRFHQFVLVLGLLTASMAGCSLDQAPTVTGAKSVVCQSLDGLRSGAVDLTTVSPETTAADLREMRKGVDRLVEAAWQANTVLQSQPITEMVTAYDSFGATVDGLAPDQRVGDAAAALRTSSTSVVAASTALSRRSPAPSR